MDIELPAIDIPDLRLKGRFYTSECPVQAYGTLADNRFYFRAKYGEWEFSVSNSPAIDPVEVERPEQGFFRSGDYEQAPELDLEKAVAIIRLCAESFLHQGDVQV
jgi:hypothetical protein